MSEAASSWDEITPEEIETLTPEDQGALATVREMRRLGNKPGILEAVLARADDEETLADPKLQESIRQMESGELTDITPID